MKHTKVKYDKIGEPRDNKRVKAHVGDVIEMAGTKVRGRVVKITNSKKEGYSDWYYKIRFENGKEQWLMATQKWKVEIVSSDKLLKGLKGKNEGCQ